MINIIKTRLKQGYRTSAFPKSVPQMPERYLGLPIIHKEHCTDGCENCIQSCPTRAIMKSESGILLDLGKCIFCGKCVPACPLGCLERSNDYRLAVNHRQTLIMGEREYQLAHALEEQTKRLFKRSLKLRQVSAGGCNACESDTNVLNTLVFDLGRFGIQFVASPRHADGLLITGPVTKNMELALLKTYEAVPTPKIVIAVGACAISGGIYQGLEQTNSGIGDLLPVDLYVPGCPPHPYTILDGLLRLLGKINN